MAKGNLHRIVQIDLQIRNNFAHPPSDARNEIPAIWRAICDKFAQCPLRECTLLKSGTKNEPKPKLFGPDIFGWGGGLPRERVGAKKFDTSLETREIKLFGRDIPGFCRDIPELPEKFEKKKFGFDFRSLDKYPILHPQMAKPPKKVDMSHVLLVLRIGDT